MCPQGNWARLIDVLLMLTAVSIRGNEPAETAVVKSDSRASGTHEYSSEARQDSIRYRRRTVPAHVNTQPHTYGQGLLCLFRPGRNTSIRYGDSFKAATDLQA